jgi:hypothetical protein
MHFLALWKKLRVVSCPALGILYINSKEAGSYPNFGYIAGEDPAPGIYLLAKSEPCSNSCCSGVPPKNKIRYLYSNYLGKIRGLLNMGKVYKTNILYFVAFLMLYTLAVLFIAYLAFTNLSVAAGFASISILAQLLLFYFIYNEIELTNTTINIRKRFWAFTFSQYFKNRELMGLEPQKYIGRVGMLRDLNKIFLLKGNSFQAERDKITINEGYMSATDVNELESKLRIIISHNRGS